MRIIIGACGTQKHLLEVQKSTHSNFAASALSSKASLLILQFLIPSPHFQNSELNQEYQEIDSLQMSIK